MAMDEPNTSKRTDPANSLPTPPVHTANKPLTIKLGSFWRIARIPASGLSIQGQANDSQVAKNGFQTYFIQLIQNHLRTKLALFVRIHRAPLTIPAGAPTTP